MTAAYTCIPVVLEGLDEERAEVVLGPDLRDSLTRAQLAHRFAAVAEELALVKRQLVVAQAAARHMEELRLRMDTECAARVEAQQRLRRVGAVLARIEQAHPGAQLLIEEARREIWGYEDV